MLKRAVSISILLHLVVVLSLATPAVLLGPGFGARPMEKLNMVLVERPAEPSPVPSAPGKQSAKEGSQLASRKAGVPVPPRSDELNFAHFLPSTVGLAKAGSERHRNPTTDALAELPSVSVSETELGEYRLNVARNARQFKVYPPPAREMGWEGVAHVAVTWPMGLATPVVSLGKSSGYAPLDHQALEMVGRAVGQTSLPDSLRGKNLTISIPVEYRLAD